jgi:site-specific DNA recombinase
MPDNLGMTKAHAYLRVFGKGRVEGDSFTRQLKAVREYAAAHEIKIVNVYREEGMSGTKESVADHTFRIIRLTGQICI